MDYKFNKPDYNNPRANKPRYNNPRANKPRYNNPRANKPRYNNPRANNPQANKPQANNPQGDFDKKHILEQFKNGIHVSLNLFFIVFSIVLIFFIIKGGYYIYVKDCDKMELSAYLFSFNIDPCSKKKADIVRTITREKEFFHISDQIYTYEEAKCKCDSYGVKLATKQDLVKAYNIGANWCTYGWCEGGSAYFPVQEQFYQSIQSTPEFRGTCGKPGLNGGIFDPALKFGINCYGIKPKGLHIPTSFESEADDTENGSGNVCEADDVKDKVQAKNSDSILSFNNNKWSSYD